MMLGACGGARGGGARRTLSGGESGRKMTVMPSRMNQPQSSTQSSCHGTGGVCAVPTLVSISCVPTALEMLNSTIVQQLSVPSLHGGSPLSQRS